ncbi:DUF397 domain-containing protein [Actinomadura chokoriensis]|uniref:DUF397 domain-containing protein n=1 Tax=Actinomadura chokoriensis TaxID=454156 RepID=A0ABV4R610_9ACTN
MTASRDLSLAHWRKSGRSSGNGQCVEVADLGADIGVRDSKAPDAGHLTLSLQVWAAFMTQAKAGHYDG